MKNCIKFSQNLTTTPRILNKFLVKLVNGSTSMKSVYVTVGIMLNLPESEAPPVVLGHNVSWRLSAPNVYNHYAK